MAQFDPNAAVSSPQFVNGTPDWVKGMISDAAAKHNIPTVLLSALLKQESGFNPQAQSPVGALGIAQFMPETAKGRGVNPLDPVSAINGAAQYLSEGLQKYQGDVAKALASYNAGFGNVDKFGGVPPFKETQNYVKSILAMAGDPHASYYGPVMDIVNQAKKQATNLVQGMSGGQVPATPQPARYSQDNWLNQQIADALKNNPQPQQQNQQSQPQPVQQPAPRPVQPVGQMPTPPQQQSNSLAYQSYSIPRPQIGSSGPQSGTSIPMPQIAGSNNAYS